MLRPSLRSVLKSVLFLQALDEGEEGGGVLVLEGWLLLSMEEDEDDDDLDQVDKRVIIATPILKVKRN